MPYNLKTSSPKELPRKQNPPLQIFTVNISITTGLLKAPNQSRGGRSVFQKNESPVLNKKSFIIKNSTMNWKKCQKDDLFDKNLAFIMPKTTKDEAGMTEDFVSSDRALVSELICDLNVYYDWHSESLTVP